LTSGNKKTILYWEACTAAVVGKCQERKQITAMHVVFWAGFDEREDQFEET
jgi:hypothetical protein